MKIILLSLAVVLITGCHHADSETFEVKESKGIHTPPSKFNSKAGDPYKNNVGRNQPDRIVGGKHATSPSQFPWQVSLNNPLYSNKEDGSFCGGTIYNQTTIITASHCLFSQGVKLSKTDVIIGYGSHKLKNMTFVEVEKLIHHENYDPQTMENDVAIIKLKQPITFSKNAKSVKIPPKGMDELAKKFMLTVSGYGAVKQGGPTTTQLKYVSIPYITNKTCSREVVLGEEIFPGMICAGLLKGGKDSCQGDSGGPFVGAKDSVLYGVVSWGYGCAKPNNPGVYVDVSYYHDWIVKKAK